MSTPLARAASLRRALPCAAAALVLAVPLAASSTAQARPTPIDYATTVINDHPTSYWRLGEDGNATIAADQMNANPGVFEGHPELGLERSTDGGRGRDNDTAVELNGTQSVDVADNGSLAFPSLEPFSLEAWIQPRTLDDTTRRIVSSEGPGGGYQLGIRDDGVYFSRYVTCSAATVSAPLTLGPINSETWTHVVGTYDGHTMTLYIGAQRVAAGTSIEALPFERDDLSLGAKESQSDFYAGGLDEVAVYPYALMPSQVLAHSIASDESFGN